MDKLLIISFFLLIGHASQGQSWAKTYWNEFDHDAFTTCIGELSDGSLIAAGHIFENGNGGDIFYYKLNPDGDVIWKYSLSRDGFEQAVDIAIHPDGGFSLLAWSNTERISINQFDEDGFLLERFTFLEPPRSFPRDFLQLENGDYLISGYTEKSEDPLVNEIDLFLLRSSFDGELIYRSTVDLAGQKWEVPTSLIVKDEFVYTSIYNVLDDVFDQSIFYLFKWNLSDGQPIWQENLGEGLITDLALSADSLSLIAAVNGPDNFCYLASISFEGDITLLKEVLPEEYCEPLEMLVLDDGSIVLSAISYEDELFTAKTSLLYFNAELDLICRQDYIDEYQTTPSSLIKLANGSVCCTNNIFNGNWSDHHPLIVKLEEPCDGPSILSKFTNSQPSKHSFQITPNPAKDFIEWSATSNIETTSFRVLSTNGRLMMAGKTNEQNRLDISHLTSGYYVLVLLKNDAKRSHLPFVKL